MRYIVETSKLTKKFGNTIAVNNLELRIKKGETYGLIGPNGSGKTTTIKLLCGLLRQNSGEIFVLGKKVPDPSILPKIGYMPQEVAIYLDLTVHENFYFFGRIYGLTKRYIAKREREILEFIGLRESKDKVAVTLSEGMRHRLSLACGLIHEPEILFLDEPTVGVDPELRSSLWDYFSELNRKGTTIVVTTHYMDEANRCDRVGLIRAGELIAEGSPEELKEKTNTSSLEDTFLMLTKG